MLENNKILRVDLKLQRKGRPIMKRETVPQTWGHNQG